MKEAEQKALAQFLRWVAESEHQSCLMLASREQLQPLMRLAHHTSAVRTLRLEGLSRDASVTLLRQRGIAQLGLDPAMLATHYGGHPLALTLLSEITQNFSTPTVDVILQQAPLLLDDLQTMLGGQLQQLSALAWEILIWLALEHGPVAFELLWEYFLATYSASAVMGAYHTLQQALLIEQQPGRQTISLPAIVQIYVIQHLIDQVVVELNHWILAKNALLANVTRRTNEQFWESSSPTINGVRRPMAQQPDLFLAPTYLNTYRLLNPHRPNSVQRAQKQFILTPILKQLVSTWGIADLISHCSALLSTINSYNLPVGRYTKVNLHTLLSLLELEPPTVNEQAVAYLAHVTDDQ